MVNIYESAIKPVVDLEDGVTVYVPGYSTIGPEEPTLCSSESEFEGLFGSSPYLFEADQEVSLISKGSPEKGYLYARSLLTSGLRVLFHRFKSSGVGTAKASFKIKSERADKTYQLAAVAYSFGKGYEGIKIGLKHNSGNLYSLVIEDRSGVKTQEEIISLDPESSLYFKLLNSPLIKFKAVENDNLVEIEDSIMLSIAKAGDAEIFEVSGVEFTGSLELKIEGDSPEYEFYLDDSSEGAGDGMLSWLAGRGKKYGPEGTIISSSENLMAPLKDFERYPSVTYITSGGYYTNKDVALAQVQYAEYISAVALVDLNCDINDEASWLTAKTGKLAFGGTSIQRGKAAHFSGCNSFNVSPYRVVLGDSFNYLKCLGENMKKGVAPWLPVANDPYGVSPLGYDTTQKIDTALAETMAESSIGICSNPLIYSTSAGGYKIMGNRTLLSNDGVLSPNSFLNVAVIVNRVARSARQTANKLKIVSTDPNSTFLKFKQSVSKTIDKMVVSQDGVLEYKIRHLPKDAPSTINIQIQLVVLEGIEKFNIYIPYQLKLD